MATRSATRDLEQTMRQELGLDFDTEDGEIGDPDSAEVEGGSDTDDLESETESDKGEASDEEQEDIEDEEWEDDDCGDEDALGFAAL